MRLVLVTVSPERPLCACGCGEQTAWGRQAKRWNRFVMGHSWRGRAIKHPELHHLVPGSAEWQRAIRRKDPVKSAEASRRFRERHPEKKRWEHLRRYGISRADYDRLLEEQGSRCSICGTDNPGRSSTGGEALFCIDHDHESGAVRGLLCRQCNAGLGSFGDSPQRLEAAYSYLMERK